MAEKRRLIWVLYPSYLLIILLSIITVTWYASASSRTFFLRQTERDLEVRARFFQNRIQDLMDSSDLSEIDRRVNLNENNNYIANRKGHRRFRERSGQHG